MWSQDLYQKALIFAAEAHKEQKVKDKNYSYTVHLSNVCAEAIRLLFEEKINNPDLMIQCALLHDTIEDTDITYADIKKTFSKEVAEGVMALTKNKKLKKEDQIQDSLNRIKKMSREIWVIKLADRITNLQKPPASWSKEKIKYYYNDAKLIYKELKDCSEFLSERIKNKIDEYEKYL